ncbi:MAG: metallophosphoesterase [Anaerolineales bacterium]
MSRLVGWRAISSTKPAYAKLWVGLAASLLLIFLQACQPATQMINQPTQRLENPSATLPLSAATVTRAPTPSQTTVPEPSQTSTPELTATTSPPVVFAAIGDYGSGDQAEADVAKLILSWQPEFIITLGDNNYPYGAAGHLDEAIGKYFHDYIFPYKGSRGAGAQVNRFFPSLGNHDIKTDNGQPYYDYFTLPGNERYYDFTLGPLHFFALNTNDSEPDGVRASSKQAAWLKAGLAASTSDWNIVYMHYPPYSSGTHGSTDWARWPYGEWGADVVLSGHDHTYERLVENGLTYIVNGLGGNGRYDFLNVLDGSQMRYNGDYGAMRVEATNRNILFQFINRSNEVVDSYEMGK